MKEGYRQPDFGQPTKRFVQVMDISDDPALMEEYRKWHSEAYSWKEVRDGIREVGILEMEIYMSGNHLVMVVDTPLDWDWQSSPPFPDKRNGRHSWPNSKTATHQPAATRNGRWLGASSVFTDYLGLDHPKGILTDYLGQDHPKGRHNITMSLNPKRPFHSYILSREMVFFGNLKFQTAYCPRVSSTFFPLMI